MSDDQRTAGGSAPLWYTKKQCELCDKFFSDSKCLKKHIQAVHSKLKPYICQVKLQPLDRVQFRSRANELAMLGGVITEF